MITTKYGNKYTNEEWKEMQDHFTKQGKEIDNFFNQLAGMKKYLRRQLAQIGISEQGINRLAYDFSEMSYNENDYGWSSEERKSQVADLWQRWIKKVEEIS